MTTEFVHLWVDTRAHATIVRYLRRRIYRHFRDCHSIFDANARLRLKHRAWQNLVKILALLDDTSWLEIRPAEGAIDEACTTQLPIDLWFSDLHWKIYRVYSDNVDNRVLQPTKGSPGYRLKNRAVRDRADVLAVVADTATEILDEWSARDFFEAARGGDALGLGE